MPSMANIAFNERENTMLCCYLSCNHERQKNHLFCKNHMALLQNIAITDFCYIKKNNGINMPNFYRCLIAIAIYDENNSLKHYYQQRLDQELS